MSLLIILLIPIICFAILLRGSFGKSPVSGADAFDHLLVADEIKKYGRKFSMGKYFVGPSGQTSPFLWGYFISFAKPLPDLINML
jgi:hypothetical protein